MTPATILLEQVIPAGVHHNPRRKLVPGTYEPPIPIGNWNWGFTYVYLHPSPMGPLFKTTHWPRDASRNHLSFMRGPSNKSNR